MKFENSNVIIEVDRNNLFNDAFNSIMCKSPQELKKRLKIKYKKEEGMDAGGLLRYLFFFIKFKSKYIFVILIYIN